ncbi:MAG: acyl-CoA dehydrogenase family protein [Pseudomonadota bacterium]
MLSSDAQKLLKIAQKHCQEIIKPNIDEWNKKAIWPRSASEIAGKQGLTGIYCPKSLGGQELPLSEGIQIYEELGKGDGAYAFTLSMHNICAYATCGFATKTFKEKWAKQLISGKKLANFALTEPQSGSDPANMHTYAELMENGHYKISGSKAWVSLAGEADLYFCVAKTSRTPGHKDMAMFAIPKASKGLTFGKRYDTASFNFLPLSEMYLNEVVVSPDHIILPAGKGLSGSLMAIDIARVSIASGCCGLIETALDTALSYAKGRKMFGKTTLDLETIQWMLGEVATNLEVSRLLYKKAAACLGSDNGPLMAAHAKAFVPEAALHAANVCTQVLGGQGLLADYGLDRLSRLAQMLKIVDGTTEIQRVVISRALKKRAAALPELPSPKGFND